MSLEERVVRLRREGHKYREITLALGISQSFLVRVLRDTGLVQEQENPDRRWPFGGALGLPAKRPRRRPAGADPDHEASVAKSYLEFAKERLRLVRRAGIVARVEPEDCRQEALLARASHPDLPPMHYVAMTRAIDVSIAACEVPYDIGRKALMCIALGDEAHPAVSGEADEDSEDQDSETWRRARKLAAEFAAWPDVEFDSRPLPETESAAKAEAREEVAMLLHSVEDERARLIVAARHGLIDGVERTLEEVGSALDLTPERVRQVEAAALKRMALVARRTEAERTAGVYAREPEAGWLEAIPPDFESAVAAARAKVPAEVHAKRKATGRSGATEKKRRMRAKAKASAGRGRARKTA